MSSHESPKNKRKVPKVTFNSFSILIKLVHWKFLYYVFKNQGTINAWVLKKPKAPENSQNQADYDSKDDDDNAQCRASSSNIEKTVDASEQSNFSLF